MNDTQQTVIQSVTTERHSNQMTLIYVDVSSSAISSCVIINNLKSDGHSSVKLHTENMYFLSLYPL